MTKSTNSMDPHDHQIQIGQNKVDQVLLNAQNPDSPLNLQDNSQHKKLMLNWGKVSPYFFTKSTNIPRITITAQAKWAFWLNLAIIMFVCVVFPLSLEHSLRNRIKFQTRGGRIMQAQSNMIISVEHPLLQRLQEAQPQDKSFLMDDFNFIFILIWSFFQLTTLILLLLSNPGYNEYHPNSSTYNTIVKNWSSSNKQFDQNGSIEDRICCLCKTLVDNSVHHCQFCDICCEGFSHHCSWVGKCIGSMNVVVFKAYTIGYMVGTLLNVTSQMILSQL